MRDVKTSNPKKTNEYHHNIACWANHFRENLYWLQKLIWFLLVWERVMIVWYQGQCSLYYEGYLWIVVFIFLIVMTVGFPYSARWGVKWHNNPNDIQILIFLSSSQKNLLWKWNIRPAELTQLIDIFPNRWFHFKAKHLDFIKEKSICCKMS